MVPKRSRINSLNKIQCVPLRFHGSSHVDPTQRLPGSIRSYWKSNDTNDRLAAIAAARAIGLAGCYRPGADVGE